MGSSAEYYISITKETIWMKRQTLFLSHLLVAGCDIGVRFSVRPSVNIYVDVRHLCQS